MSFSAPDLEPDDSVSSSDTARDIRRAALNMLARREHSLREMQQKLERRFADREQLAGQLQLLIDEGLQNDQRFAESFARQRAQRGYGPVRLRQEMRERGLSDLDIAGAFEAAELDWWALAEQVFTKKFGARLHADRKQLARCVRFMQYRGFQAEHFSHLLPG